MQSFERVIYALSRGLLTDLSTNSTTKAKDNFHQYTASNVTKLC